MVAETLLVISSSCGSAQLAVLIAGVEALDDTGGRAAVPHRHASHCLHDARIPGEARQLARGAGPSCIAECPHDEGNEEVGISHHDIRLDALQVFDPELPAARQERCQQLLDASGADAQVEAIARTDIANAATGTQHVEHVVVAAVAGGIVVGVDDEPARRIDQLRHLTEGQDGEGQRAIGIVALCRQPLVAALAIADEERWQSNRGAVLQILTQRHLAGGEVGDVALLVGVGEVLRPDVEAL